MTESNEWSKYVPWVTTVLLGGYVIYKAVHKDRRSEWVNKTIQKDSDKVVDVVDIEDLGAKTSFCRCWISEKFPICDGLHKGHNKCTGDNVSKLVLKKAL